MALPQTPKPGQPAKPFLTDIQMWSSLLDLLTAWQRGDIETKQRSKGNKTTLTGTKGTAVTSGSLQNLDTVSDPSGSTADAAILGQAFRHPLFDVTDPIWNLSMSKVFPFMGGIIAGEIGGFGGNRYVTLPVDRQSAGDEYAMFDPSDPTKLKSCATSGVYKILGVYSDADEHCVLDTQNGQPLWRFELTEDWPGASSATAKLKDLNGTVYAPSVEVLDPLGENRDKVSGDEGLCMLVGSEFVVIGGVGAGVSSGLARFELTEDLEPCGSASALRLVYAACDDGNCWCGTGAAAELYDSIGVAKAYGGGGTVPMGTNAWASQQSDSSKWEIVSLAPGCCEDDSSESSEDSSESSVDSSDGSSEDSSLPPIGAGCLDCEDETFVAAIDVEISGLPTSPHQYGTPSTNWYKFDGGPVQLNGIHRFLMEPSGEGGCVLDRYFDEELSNRYWMENGDTTGCLPDTPDLVDYVDSVAIEISGTGAGSTYLVTVSVRGTINGTNTSPTTYTASGDMCVGGTQTHSIFWHTTCSFGSLINGTLTIKVTPRFGDAP